MSSIMEYKCLNCKAGLEFDPPSQKWKCGYCLSEFEKEQLISNASEEDSLNQDMAELDSYNCTSCGAQLIASGTTSATFCVYCKSPTIIKERFSGKFKPSSLIPFKLTKSQAEDTYRQWISKRLFTPNEFKTKEEIESITGVYAPFWLFDCQVHGDLEGEGTRIRSWTEGDYRYTQTEYFSVVRQGTVRYNRVPIDASKKLDDSLIYTIEPYNYADLTEFAMPYMSGFLAEKFDFEAHEAEQIMMQRVEEYTLDRLSETISGYSSYQTTGNQFTVSDKTHSYSLLPVYVLVNKYKGKEYIFMINGQTGKIAGDPPVSFWKQVQFAGCIFAIVWLLAVFGGALFA